MRVIKDICGATTGSARDIENWISRLKLRTPFEPTKRGRARRYTWENTLELTIMVALVRAGSRPSTARLLAGFKATDPTFEPATILVRDPRNEQVWFSGDSFAVRSLPAHLRTSDVLIVVQEKQIVERAKSFFDDHAIDVSDYSPGVVAEYDASDFADLLPEGGEDD